MTATAPASPIQVSSEGWAPLRGLLMSVAVVVALIAGWTLTGRLTSSEVPVSGLGPMESVDQSAFAGETGVWIEHISLRGGGGLIEIRYRILDADKSQIVHDYDNPPRVIAPDGFEIRFQRHEHSHVRENRLGSTYNEQLVNLSNYLRVGDLVTVVIGEVALEGVPVQ